MSKIIGSGYNVKIKYLKNVYKCLILHVTCV